MGLVFVHREAISSETMTSNKQIAEFQVLRCVRECRLRLTLQSNFGRLTLDRMVRGGLFKYPMEVLLTKP